MTVPDDSERSQETRRLHDGDLQLEAAAVSDRGTVRTENQDGWSIVELARAPGAVILVADGMGGLAGGRAAAHAALTEAGNTVRDAEDPKQALMEAFVAADRAVGRERAGREPGGTTLVGALISNGQVRVGNIGDSRAYVLRGGALVLVTEDHSLIEEQVRSGAVDPETAATMPGRNILTRALTGEHAPADFFDFESERGDLVFLCSDGLWGALSEAELQQLFSMDGDLLDLVTRACDAALRAGSRDNVTVAACRVS